MTTRRLLLVAAVTLSVVCTAACERAGKSTPAPAEQGKAPAEVHTSATLALTVVEQTAEEVVLELRHHPRADSPLPRMMELHLRLTDNLKLVSATKGAAAEAVAKELVVQEKADHVLRTVLFSAQNLDLLGDGVLARYRLARTDAKPAKVELMNKMPVFAPPAANEGFLLPDPLEIAAP